MLNFPVFCEFVDKLYTFTTGTNAEKVFNLKTVIYIRMRNSLTVDHILVGKELTDQDATPFGKLWLNCNHRLAIDIRVGKNQ